MSRVGSFGRSVFIGLIIVGLLALATKSAKAGPVEEGDRAYLQGHIEAAIQLWTPPATQGSAEAQYRLSQAYLSGRGVARDLELGLKWLTLSAERHYPPALIDLAELKLDPRTVMYEPEEAAALLRDADATPEFFPVNEDKPGEYDKVFRFGIEQLANGSRPTASGTQIAP